MITSQNRPGLPDFSRRGVTLKNMGRPGDEARRPDQTKRSRTTRQTQRKHKPVKRRVEKERVELPGTAQPSTGASSQGHSLQPPRTKKK